MPAFLANLTALLLLTGCQTDTVRVGDVEFVAYQLPVEGSDVAAADLNGDGNADLVGGGKPLSIFLGDGSGSLSLKSRVDGGENPTDIKLSDVDSDSDLDIIVANHETDHVTILLGNGDGSFDASPQSPFVVAVDPHPHYVETADLNADGVVDLIVDDRNHHGVRIFAGLGNGRFDTSSMLIDVGGDPYIGMAIADLDGDGQLDIVTPNPHRLSLVFSEDAAAFQFVSPADLSAENPFGVRSADFNADGLTDLISVSGENSSSTQILLGNGKGSFSNATNWNPFSLTGPKLATVGDFNGDGIDDAAVACYRVSDVMLILGGRDSFQTTLLPAGEHPWGLAAADFNGDGVDDLVIADDGRSEAIVYLSSVRIGAAN
jgi:hypothetical protein